MKTKPFNLEEALAGAKVVTRSGKEVKQLTLFNCAATFPVYALIDGQIESFTVLGNYGYQEDSENDLLLVVEVKKIYINVYEHEKNGLFVSTQCFKDKKTAIINKNNFEGLKVTYIKTIEITDEP